MLNDEPVNLPSLMPALMGFIEISLGGMPIAETVEAMSMEIVHECEIATARKGARA